MLCSMLNAVIPSIDAENFPGLMTTTQRITLNTLYGRCEITEPVLIELIESTAMQRLKDVYQLDIWRYAVQDDSFNRYDHSIGVFVLVRLHGGSLQEQVSALLHDVSHTAFSHSGALLFVDSNKAVDEFQDSSHMSYLKKSGLVDILHKHGFSVEDIDHKGNNFRRLEQELPDLCADRIDYNIRGALWAQLISFEEAQLIIKALHFNGHDWYLSDQHAARLLADVSVVMTKGIWGSPEKAAMSLWLKTLLRRARDLHLITADDITFSTDERLWRIFKKSNDAIISDCLHKIEHPYEYFTLDEEHYSFKNEDKFRGVNPLIQDHKGNLIRLAALDGEYAENYEKTKRDVEHGWPIRLITS